MASASHDLTSAQSILTLPVPKPVKFKYQNGSLILFAYKFASHTKALEKSIEVIIKLRSSSSPRHITKKDPYVTVFGPYLIVHEKNSEVASHMHQKLNTMTVNYLHGRRLKVKSLVEAKVAGTCDLEEGEVAINADSNFARILIHLGQAEKQNAQVDAVSSQLPLLSLSSPPGVISGYRGTLFNPRSAPAMSDEQASQQISPLMITPPRAASISIGTWTDSVANGSSNSGPSSCTTTGFRRTC